MKKFLITTAFAAASATAMTTGATQAQAQDACEGEIVITEMNWASSALVTAVASFLMEQGYGCDVRKLPSSSTPALVSVAETGKPDIVTELWTNSEPALPRMEAAGQVTTLTDVLSDGGVEGWYVPTPLIEEHPELATLEGVLANPELVGGRFHQCPEGWACQNSNAALIEVLGLEEKGFEIFQHGSGETMATAIAAAFEGGEPYFGYYFAPTSVLSKYDMTSLDLGPYDEETFKCNASGDCDDVGMTSFPVGPVKTVVTTDFADRHPEVAELMANVSFTNDQMGDVLAWQEANNASTEEAAVYFLTTYSDVWSEWVNDAAREKLGALSAAD